MAEKLLSGIRVLDLSERVAGPYCTKMLADYGAEVLKVEKPGLGDVSRRMGPFLQDVPDPEKSGLFLYLNTNKKGITLDLETESGIQILKRLAADADVLVEDLPPGKMAALGLGWEDLERINPNLVYTSISAFGQTGPYRDWQSVDIVPYALSGWMSVTGDPEREPLKTGGRIGEYMPGLLAGVGTLACLFGREITGGGQQVDISALETIHTVLSYYTMGAAYQTGFSLARQGNRQPTTHPYTILPAADGYVGVISFTSMQWEMICQMMGIPELLEDERFQTNPDRRAHADLVDEAMKPWLTSRSKEECFHAGQEWRIPFGMVSTIADLLEMPQHRARDYFVEIDHPAAGKQTYPGAPFKIADAPWVIRAPAPLLGQHNVEIYGALGYDKEDLVRLAAQGVI